MPATAYSNLTIANIDGLISYLDTIQLAAGWTSLVVMQPSGAPYGVGTIGHERIYQISGTTSSPTNGYVGIVRENLFTATNTIGFYGFTGHKPAVAITAISYPGTGNYITVTAPGHTFVNGDLVFINGVSNTQFNFGCVQNTSESDVYTISSVVAGTSFQYRVPSVFSSSVSSSGGYAIAVYNMASSRIPYYIANGSRWTGSDGPMQIFGEIDEFRNTFIIKQGGNTRFVSYGMAGRRHIPAAFSDTAFTTATVTGPGAFTVTLDRSPVNLYVGQYAWLVDNASGLFERFQLTTFTGNVVGGTLLNTGTYSSGALFGDDPCPLVICGGEATSATTTQDLTAYVGRAAFFTNGTRTDSAVQSGVLQSYIPAVDSCVTGVNGGTDGSGYDQLAPLIYVRTTTPVGVRKNMCGTSVDLIAAVPISTQNDDDLEQTGSVVPGSVYAVFPSQPIKGPDNNATYGISFGPGA